MNPLESWQRQNNEYLGAALRWLRLRLLIVAEKNQALQAAFAGAEPGSSPAAGSVSAFPIASSPETQGASDGLNASLDWQCRQAEAEKTVAEGADFPPALVTLSRRFGLSSFERDILFLCIAMELDTSMGRLCARAQGDPACSFPTFALALSLFDEPAWEALSPGRPLRYWQLLEIQRHAAQPLTVSPLRADERIVNYVKGLNYLDDRLTTLAVPIHDDAYAEPLDDACDQPVDSNGLPPSQQEILETILANLRTASQDPPVIQLVGADSSSKEAIALRTANELGLDLYRLAAETLPGQWPEFEILTRLWRRESVLLPVALYLDASDAERESQLLKRAIPRIGPFVFLDTREAWSGLGRDTLSMDVTKPTCDEQRNAWEAALGAGAGESSRVLSNQFNLGASEIRRISRTALQQNGQPLEQRLWKACLAAARPRLDTLAQRLEPKVTWNDLVLAEPELAQLRRIVAQVSERHRVYGEWGFDKRMNRGLGISALFVGESGTGKTMAAEVMANELRMNLYRIDLSAVVSKYIGETEKNLRRVFDAAEDGGAILFFDEADALFGKRSEVKDSHDRYANIEINYLLQRMEAYRGLAILATNMKSALDQAFMRRLRFVINFPFPDPAERRLIWEKVFPPQTPLGRLDHERLSCLNLTGGSIHNIALNAAFLAAQANSKVTMRLLMEAARSEFRKLEKPTHDADFRWEDEAVALA
jgi:ATP-dependent 26S proteasome regulatory subunit